MLRFHLRIVAFFFASCALLACGLHALLALEQAAEARQAMIQDPPAAREQAEFDWISREQPDEEINFGIAALPFDGCSLVPPVPRVVTFHSPVLKAGISNDSPSVLLSRPPPTI